VPGPFQNRKRYESSFLSSAHTAEAMGCRPALIPGIEVLLSGAKRKPDSSHLSFTLCDKSLQPENYREKPGSKGEKCNPKKERKEERILLVTELFMCTTEPALAFHENNKITVLYCMSSSNKSNFLEYNNLGVLSWI
jgi:hypothetical protein